MNKQENSWNEQLSLAREEGMRQGKITATVKCIRKLMGNLDLPLENVLALLEIPRKERKTYRGIIGAAEKQRQATKSVGQKPQERRASR